MGLAASQARFLAITSRKTNCEFQSMQIAQNKLSISRELAQATTDYQNSLNATKLVWDFDCDNTGYLATPCQNAVNLSYNTLMIPSIYNNYQPYLTTTKTGAIVLNPKYAAAARAAGIAAGSGEQPRSKEGFYKFLNALVNNGLLPESTNNAIQEGKFYVYQGKRAEDGGNTYVYKKELDPSDAKDNKLIIDNKLNTIPKYGFMDADNNTLEEDMKGNQTFKDKDGNIIGTIANGQTNVLDKDGNIITDQTILKKFNKNNFTTKVVVNENGYIKGYDPNAGFGSTPLNKNPVLASNIIGLALKLTDNIYTGDELNFNNRLSNSTTAGNSYKISLNNSYLIVSTSL